MGNKFKSGGDFKLWDDLANKISEKQRKFENRLESGLKGSDRTPVAQGLAIEPKPILQLAAKEKYIGGKANAGIVMGNDRLGSLISGYGGRGDTHCAKIDIVAGYGGYQATSINSEGKEVYARPSVKLDAARIYISQKTDVDKEFGLKRGTMPLSKARSAVAIKADGVRIVAREGVKIVTGVDSITSQGNDIPSNKPYGIDLIAGNDDSDLQPIPKGDNVVAAFKQVIWYIDQLRATVDNIVHAQLDFNAAVAGHFHINMPIGPTTVALPLTMEFGARTLPRLLLKAKIPTLLSKINLTTFERNYLEPSPGGKYILSERNHTN